MARALDGLVAVVTGGAQGIGWATAHALAENGSTVYVCDSNPQHLQQAQALLDQYPGIAIHLAACDVTDRAAVEAWIAGIYQDAGRVDMLVNNAISFRWGSVLATSIEDAEHTMRVGYNAMVYTTKAVLPRMLAAQRGHIVNMSSSVSQAPILSEIAAYTATKAAIDTYSRVLQHELRDTPVCVSIIRPTTVAGTSFLARFPAHWVPRLTDFAPVVTPPVVAAAIVRAIRTRREITNVPGYLPCLYALAVLLPRPVRWLVTHGGSARRDYAAVTWPKRMPPHAP